MTFQPLDGPSLQDRISVGSGSVSEAKVGVAPLVERKALTIQPLDGRVFVFFGYENTVPSVSDLTNKGFLVLRNAKETYEASDSQHVYLLSETGSTNVIIVERA